jgi:hypothetical protein
LFKCGRKLFIRSNFVGPYRDAPMLAAKLRLFLVDQQQDQNEPEGTANVAVFGRVISTLNMGGWPSL